MTVKYKSCLLIATLYFTDIVLGFLLLAEFLHWQEPTEYKPDSHPCEITYAQVSDKEARQMPWANDAGTCTVTYYCPCLACCGKEDGITYSGSKAVPYETCAVDPEVIPLGSTILIDFGDGLIQAYRADDTGSGVKGNHIDICVGSHNDAVKLGVKTATVYWNEVIS